jgi:hypothetical protein
MDRPPRLQVPVHAVADARRPASGACGAPLSPAILPRQHASPARAPSPFRVSAVRRSQLPPPVRHPSMKARLQLFFAGIASLVSANAAPAQQVPVYAPPSETVFVESINPHLMYWVVGPDSVGTPVESVTLETQRWTRSGAQLEVIVRQESLLPEESVGIDTFRIEPDGRVASINGAPPALQGRVDFLPRLPARELRVGAGWADTLRTVTEGAAGEHVYAVSRQYRVTRSVDTLDTRVVEIVAEGEVHYRDGWWADPARTVAAWIDVRGPVVERIGFDPARGQVVYRGWWMDLKGSGAIPDGAGGSRKVPAGLLSGSRSRVVTFEEAEALRASPGRALRPPS